MTGRNCTKNDIAVCILFYEKVDQTIECIQSFLPSGVNIYVLNNGSSSASRMKLGNFYDKYEQIKIFDSNLNLGVSVGRNYLIEHTQENWLLFVDNDAVMNTQDWLVRFKRHVEDDDNNIEVFIPKVFSIQDGSYGSHYKLRISKNKVKYEKIYRSCLTNKFPGGSSFINRILFKRLGLYDDKMFTGYEDIEYAIRGILSGAPVKAKIIDDIYMTHDHRTVEKEEDKKAVLIRYDINMIQQSYDRIHEKHGINMHENWKVWVKSQADNMVKSEKRKAKNNILGLIKVGWNNIRLFNKRT